MDWVKAFIAALAVTVIIIAMLLIGFALLAIHPVLFFLVVWLVFLTAIIRSHNRAGEVDHNG